MLQKGIYPYEYVDCWEKYRKTELPPQDAFQSFLNFSTITLDDYRHAQNVFETFQLKNFADYTKLYVECDTLLLADVMHNFRKLCFKHYGLEPVGNVIVRNSTF